MNVLLISQYFPPDLGGVASRTNNLANGLVANGCKVTVIAAFPHYPNGVPKQYRWRPFQVEQMGNIRIFRTFVFPLKSTGFLRRLLLMGSFAVSALFAFPWIGKTDAVWGTSWTPGLFYSKTKRAPVVLDVCDLTIEDLPMLKLAKEDSMLLKVAAAVYRVFYLKGDAVSPISPGYVETIEKKYRVKKERINVVENGVDLTVFQNIPKKPKRTNQEPFKIIYAGVLGVGYDFEQIFSAAKQLESEGLGVEFVLHGGGECLETIRKRLKELNLSNVHLSEKLLPSRKDVAAFLSTADVLIFPLKDYGAPYPGIASKLYEYQAVGKPVICCAEGACANYIKKSKSGIVTKPEDSAALAQAVTYLYSNPEVAKTLGENGRKYVEKYVNVGAIGANVKALFIKLRKERHLVD